ncbi:MAG TPA: hypothetical protein VII94_03620 [Candidatus Saccharimonadales bacterium]
MKTFDKSRPVIQNEYLVIAVSSDCIHRVWTRNTLSEAKHMAERAVNKEDSSGNYIQAIVLNIFGGLISDILYRSEVKKEE